MSTITSPQGYTAVSGGYVTLDPTSPLLIFDPPLVPWSYNASLGLPPPSSAWNTSAPASSWKEWENTGLLSGSEIWAFTDTPGSSFTFSFVGSSAYFFGSFANQNTAQQNETLSVTVDNEVMTASNSNSDKASPSALTVSGFGLGQTPEDGYLGYIGQLSNDYHEITLKLNKDWLNLSSIGLNYLSGSSHATPLEEGFSVPYTLPNVTSASGYEVAANGTWLTGTPPSSYQSTWTPGSSLLYNMPPNASFVTFSGYAGPDAGNYSVTLQEVGVTAGEPGTISWYGMATVGMPATTTYTAKRQWREYGSVLYATSLDTLQQYEMIITFLGPDGSRFAVGDFNYNVDQLMIPGSTSGTVLSTNDLIGVIVGVVGFIAIACFVLFCYRQRRRRRLPTIRGPDFYSKNDIPMDRASYWEAAKADVEVNERDEVVLPEVTVARPPPIRNT
ncbi:hypothetical protein BD324DRAFT_626864 [Kockovaella imperatae]|uniref:Uncharacterized protein n=1 Tax=Kockovaella imperatae TaxID=4999 RepID=A0A1Y1UFD7_9TREE|nr:hypothetical protein BD324DRAFT_626864 [Kockovaella imperatae]ORX36699.1 hypothetical protein BD324DRAFT_626864 [Kockovaella imperatae]